MTTKKKRIFGYILTAIIVGCLNPIVFADSEFKGQQFLFMTKEGYSREKGEFQISFTNQYKVRKRIKEGDEIKRKNQWWWITEIEYGLSDRLETEIPFEHIHKRTIEDGSTTNLSETGIGDVGTGISLRLTGEERHKWWSHTISTGFVLLWSTGRWRKELGTDQFCWETNLAISKTFDKWAYHFTGSFGITDDAREEGESTKKDVRECGIGGALVYRPTHKWDFICELVSEIEREKTRTNENHETEFYIVPGIGHKMTKYFEIGLGVPFGLTS